MYTNKQTDIQTKKVLQQIDERYLNIIIGNNWGLLIPEMDPCHYSIAMVETLLYDWPI